MLLRQSLLYLHDTVYKNSNNVLINNINNLYSNMNVSCIIPLKYRLTGHPENFKIKLYYFQERLSLRYSITLKLLTLSHICF